MYNSIETEITISRVLQKLGIYHEFVGRAKEQITSNLKKRIIFINNSIKQILELFMNRSWLSKNIMESSYCYHGNHTTGSLPLNAKRLGVFAGSILLPMTDFI